MANTVIGALSVEISVDSQGVKDGLKASGEALKVGGEQLREGANKWGKWAVAAVAATAAVTAAIVKTNLTNIRELKNSAIAADETVESFQRGAFAAEQFGISQEKYGDILKDVNDRVGDFLITGAGPMVDFFEQIAPKVDVTADSFKNLSGSQSLGLYIESLQKAGASQQEMTFFMEALAGDATRLIPLFNDNSKAFNALTFEAKALGIGLSAIDVEKAEMASKSIAKSLAVTEAFGQELTVQLAPIIGSVIDLFEDMAKEAGGASQFISKGIAGVIDVVGVFADGLHGVQVIFKGLEIAALGFSALATNVFFAVSRVIATSLDGWIMMVNDTVTAINAAFDTGIEPLSLATDSSMMSDIENIADDMVGVLSDANGDLHNLLMQPLPSDQIKNFADASIAEYDRIAKARVDASKHEPSPDHDKESSRIREESKDILNNLVERGSVEAEIMSANFDRQQEILEKALQNQLITRKAFNKALDSITKVSKLKPESSVDDSGSVDKNEPTSLPSTGAAEGKEGKRLREENATILAALLERGDIRERSLLESLKRQREILDKNENAKGIDAQRWGDASVELDRKIANAKAIIDITGAGDKQRRLREENEAVLAEMAKFGSLTEEQILNRFNLEQIALDEAIKNKKISEEAYLASTIDIANRLANAKLTLSNASEFSESEKIYQENEQILSALISQGDMRVETLFDRLEREQSVLNLALEKKRITEEQHAKASVDVEERTAKAKLGIALSTVSAISSALANGGKKAQKVSKALAVAGAIVSGGQAAIAAWRSGMETPGPWAPVVAASYAAASIAKTTSMISSIRSGGKVSSPGRISAPSTPSSRAGGSGSQQDNLPESRNISINLTGEGLMSTDQVRDLISQINEATNDGVQLITTGG